MKYLATLQVEFEIGDEKVRGLDGNQFIEYVLENDASNATGTLSLIAVDAKEVILDRVSLLDLLKADETRTSKKNPSILEEFIFDTKTEAYSVLNNMEDAISKYGFVTVADFYDMLNITEIPSEISSVIHTYGWTELPIIIPFIKGIGWAFSLPQPKFIEVEGKGLK